MLDKNQTLKLASVIFGIVALLHLLRSLLGWSLIIESYNVPLYFSYIAVIVTGYLSWQMYDLSKKQVILS